MDSVKLKVYSVETGASSVIDKCVSMRLEKERYTPYTTLSGVFVCVGDIGEISKVRASINNKNVHYGPIDTFRKYRSGGVDYINFTSRGFSMGLSQNQLEPGMKLNPDLQGLLELGVTVPYVTCETGTQAANYIFVKNGSSLWDAVVALCQKVTGGYPYIGEENKVMFSPPEGAAVVIPEKAIVEKGRGSYYTSIISHFHMKDVDDTYAFNYESVTAQEREIVRHKYIDLDRQWLSSPEDGLMHKNRFSERGINYQYFRHAGYSGADIRSKVVCGSISGNEVSRIQVDFGKSGLFTTLWFYDDRYSG